MKYLLDTHVFIWWLNDDKRLDKKTKEIIKNPKNQIYTSVISAWEISIKQTLKKIALKDPISKYFSEPGFNLLDISLEHVLELQNIPLLHRDPFDRMLICQSRVEKLKLITFDSQVKKYFSH